MFERGKKLAGMLNLVALAIWVGILVGAVALIVGKDLALIGLLGMVSWTVLTYRSIARTKRAYWASRERGHWGSKEEIVFLSLRSLALQVRRVLGKVNPLRLLDRVRNHWWVTQEPEIVKWIAATFKWTVCSTALAMVFADPWVGAVVGSLLAAPALGVFISPEMRGRAWNWKREGFSALITTIGAALVAIALVSAPWWATNARVDSAAVALEAEVEMPPVLERLVDFVNADTAYGDGTLSWVEACWTKRAELDANKGQRSEQYWAGSCRGDVLLCQKESRARFGGSGEAYFLCMEDTHDRIGLLDSEEEVVRDMYEWTPYIVEEEEPMVLEFEPMELQELDPHEGIE